MTVEIITQKQIKELLNYDPDTGIFTWLKSGKGRPKRNNLKAGSMSNGYILISIAKKRYSAHRLAWIYMYDEIPSEIDHIDHCRANNRISNLRTVTRRENLMNRTISRNNNSKVTGVCWEKENNCWRAFIHDNGKQTKLGRFTNIFDAICARKSAEHKCGYHPNHGKS